MIIVVITVSLMKNPGALLRGLFCVFEKNPYEYIFLTCSMNFIARALGVFSLSHERT